MLAHFSPSSERVPGGNLETLFALDLLRAQTFVKYSPVVIWRVFTSFINIYAKFARVLPAQMASQFYLQIFWLESVTSKNPRMHSGWQHREDNGDEERNWPPNLMCPLLRVRFLSNRHIFIFI